MIFSILLYAICLIVSAVGAWTDIKTGRVRNSHLLTTAGIAIILGIIMFAVQRNRLFDFPRWAINLGFSIVLSAVFYLSDIWAPGDAKLFILIAALYPPDFYASPSGNVFPSLSIVVFAYAMGYVFLVITAFRNHEKRDIRSGRIILDKTFIMGYLVNVGVIIGLSTLMNSLLPAFYEANQTLVLLCIVGICYVVQRRWHNLLTLVGVVGLIAAVILTVSCREYQTLLISLPLSLFLALLTQILLRMADSNSYREISGDELKPGMILSFSSILAMQKCIDPNIPKQTTENRRSRLSIIQTEAVRKWCRITGNSITIVEMLPFAPFICLGIIIELGRHLLFY